MQYRRVVAISSLPPVQRTFSDYYRAAQLFSQMFRVAPADGHRSGVLVEELTLARSFTPSRSTFPGIVRVKILVEGKERETLAGHADLSDFYDVTAVNQLAAQLQSAQ
jgi:hypothetical protein